MQVGRRQAAGGGGGGGGAAALVKRSWSHCGNSKHVGAAPRMVRWAALAHQRAARGERVASCYERGAKPALLMSERSTSI